VSKYWKKIEMKFLTSTWTDVKKCAYKWMDGGKIQYKELLSTVQKYFNMYIGWLLDEK
jgi:hypothetical protein